MEKKRDFHGLGSCNLQIFRKMKLTVLALLLSIVNVWASSGYAQTARLTVEARNLSLEEFFRKIEDQMDTPAKLTTLRRFILTTLRRLSLTTSSL